MGFDISMYQQLRFKGLKQFQSDDKRRDDNRRTIEQDIYFVETVHFFAASFCSFFTSCLMILFLCKGKNKTECIKKYSVTAGG